MAAWIAEKLPKLNRSLQNVVFKIQKNNIHLTTVCCEVQSGKYKVTNNRIKPLTYEKACKPYHIAHKKAWNSWNTSAIKGGLRAAETAIEDLFIRKFITGTFSQVCSEVIIKRQYNIIRISALVLPKLNPGGITFLMGYSEELLSYWLQCPVKLEFQFIKSPDDVIFKYV